MRLTEDQIARGMERFRKANLEATFEMLLKDSSVDVGDGITLTYTLTIGSTGEIESMAKELCGELSEMGLSCHLKKNHIGKHCHVFKWLSEDTAIVVEKGIK